MRGLRTKAQREQRSLGGGTVGLSVMMTNRERCFCAQQQRQGALSILRKLYGPSAVHVESPWQHARAAESLPHTGRAHRASAGSRAPAQRPPRRSAPPQAPASVRAPGPRYGVSPFVCMVCRGRTEADANTGQATAGALAQRDTASACSWQLSSALAGGPHACVAAGESTTSHDRPAGACLARTPSRLDRCCGCQHLAQALEELAARHILHEQVHALLVREHRQPAGRLPDVSGSGFQTSCTPVSVVHQQVRWSGAERGAHMRTMKGCCSDARICFSLYTLRSWRRLRICAFFSALSAR